MFVVSTRSIIVCGGLIIGRVNERFLLLSLIVSFCFKIWYLKDINYTIISIKLLYVLYFLFFNINHFFRNYWQTSFNDECSQWMNEWINEEEMKILQQKLYICSNVQMDPIYLFRRSNISFPFYFSHTRPRFDLTLTFSITWIHQFNFKWMNERMNEWMNEWMNEFNLSIQPVKADLSNGNTNGLIVIKLRSECNSNGNGQT